MSEGIVDEAGNYNGKWKDLYPDGKVLAEGQYTDNRRTGLWKFYNQSAESLNRQDHYNNGRPDGLWKWYYENGAILREEEYFQGQRDGAYTEYSPERRDYCTGTVSLTEKETANGNSNRATIPKKENILLV
ncbi:MAG: hypothetical protein MZU84_00495 [Sphingobacterium sp.]|nr:hypothetical protein [Sphingobacterium sp.]